MQLMLFIYCLFCLCSSLVHAQRTSGDLVFLEDNDWSNVNSLLREIIIEVPDIPTTQVQHPIPITFSASNIQCTGFSIGALSVKSQENYPQDTVVKAILNSSGLTAQCRGDLNVTLSGLPPGHGQIVIESNSSHVNLAVAMEILKPTRGDTFVRLDDCDAGLVISQLSVSGDSTMKILNELLAKIDVNSLLGDSVDRLLCDSLYNFTSTTISSMAKNVSGELYALSELSSRLDTPKAERKALLKAESAVKESLGPIEVSQLANLSNSTAVSFISELANLFLAMKSPCYLGSAEAGKLGINGLLRKIFGGRPGGVPSAKGGAFLNIILGHGDGINIFKFNSSFIAFSGLLRSIYIDGFDTISQLSLLEQVSDLHLRSGVHFDGPLRIFASLQVTIAIPMGQSVVQQLSIEISDMKDISFNVSTLLAFDGSFGGLPLGPSIPHMKGCLLQFLKNASFTTVTDVHVGGKPSFDIHGFFPKSPLDGDLNSIFFTISRYLGKSLAKAAPGIMQTILLPKINSILKNVLNQQKAQLSSGSVEKLCPINASSAGLRPNKTLDKSIDLSTSLILELLSVFVERVLSPKLNMFIRNASISCGQTPGRLDLVRDILGRNSGVLFANDWDIPQLGKFHFEIGNFSLENMDTIREDEVIFLKTPDPYSLQSKVVFGDDSSSSESHRPVRIAADIVLSLLPWKANGSSVKIDDKFRLGLSLLNATFASDLLIAINTYSLQAIPLHSIVKPRCLIGLLDDFRFESKRNLSEASLATRIGNEANGHISSVEVACRSNDTFGKEEEGDSGGDFSDSLRCSSPALAPDWVSRSRSSPAIDQFNTYTQDGVESLFQHFENDAFHKQLLSDLRLASKGCGYDGPGDHTSSAKSSAEGDIFWDLTHPPHWEAPSCFGDKAAAVVYTIIIGSAIVGFFIRFFVLCAQAEQASMKKRQTKSCCFGVEFVKFCHGDYMPCRACCQGASARVRNFCWCLCCCPPRKLGRSELDLRETLLSPVHESSMIVTEASLHFLDPMFNGGNVFYQAAPGKSEYSLVQHPRIPIYVRYGVILLIFFDICLFFSSHASMGASVDMQLNLLGDEMQYHTIFPFGLGYSLVNLWGACAVVLVAFLATFSGGWVYMKLLLMAMLWCAPPSILSVKDRGRYFHLLDVFGKWSLLDLFVLVQSMVGFFVRIAHPDLLILPENFYHINLIVTPAYGLYSFCLAVIVSLLLSHAQVVYHRNAATEVGSARSNSINSGEDESARVTSWFDFGADDTEVVSVKSLSLQSSKKFSIMLVAVPFLLLFSFISLFWGAITPSWTFTTRGIAGIVVEFGNESASVRRQSLYSAVTQLMLQSSLTTPFWSNGFGVVIIACLYASLCFVIPILTLVGMALLWVYPMPLRKTKICLFLVQIFSSFSALEVWILGVCVTVFQIKFVSYSVLDRQCYSLKPLFHGLARYGFIQMEDAECFQIDGNLEWRGITLLMTAALFSQIASHIVLREANLSIHRREKVIQSASKRTGFTEIPRGISSNLKNRNDADPEPGTKVSR